ncbi:MAG: preprotein translocase subunit YajC [Gemmatimonadota bacterium]
MRRGEEVATAGGLIGEIVHLKDDRVTLKTGDDTRVTVERDKVLRRLGTGPESAETS